jgi:hypothetical protein
MSQRFQRWAFLPSPDLAPMRPHPRRPLSALLSTSPSRPSSSRHHDRRLASPHGTTVMDHPRPLFRARWHPYDLLDTSAEDDQQGSTSVCGWRRCRWPHSGPWWAQTSCGLHTVSAVLLWRQVVLCCLLCSTRKHGAPAPGMEMVTSSSTGDGWPRWLWHFDSTSSTDCELGRCGFRWKPSSDSGHGGRWRCLRAITLLKVAPMQLSSTHTLFQGKP